MPNIRSALMGVILIVIGVTLVPTIFDAVWSDAVSTDAGLTVNGTAWSLLTLVPMIFVGAVVIGGIVLAIK